MRGAGSRSIPRARTSTTSPTSRCRRRRTLDAYLDAASEISRLAVGDPHASVERTDVQGPAARVADGITSTARRSARAAASRSFTISRPTASTSFAVSLHAIPTGQLYGSSSPFDEKIEVSVNGERVALLDVTARHVAGRPERHGDPNAQVPVRAGPQRVTAAFLRTFEGPVNDNLAPHRRTASRTRRSATSMA